jgi:hypothetical protein
MKCYFGSEASEGGEFVRIKKWIKNSLNRVLKHYGQEILETESVYEWQRLRVDQPCWVNNTLSEDAAR